MDRDTGFLIDIWSGKFVLADEIGYARPMDEKELAPLVLEIFSQGAERRCAYNEHRADGWSSSSPALPAQVGRGAVLLLPQEDRLIRTPG
jgi:hypothetical protein